MFDNATIIHAYTRADALADGNLVDVSEQAKSFGFRIPVALTTTAWQDCVEWREAIEEREHPQDGLGQSESGRLADVLTMAYHAVRSAKEESTVLFQVLRIPRDGESQEPTLATLRMHIGPGDKGEPVITVMMEDED